MNTEFGKRLRMFVDHTGISDKEFADKISCTKQELSNWIHGTKISFNRISDISKSFKEFNVGWFITGEGNMIKTSDTITEDEFICQEKKCIIEMDKLKNIIIDQQAQIIKLQKEKIEWIENRK